MTPAWRHFPVVVITLAALAAAAPAAGQPAGAPRNECIACHETLASAQHAAPVAAFREDVHQQRGFACVDCHGGDPTAPDVRKAKAPSTGFRGAPRGQAQIAVCARCHSDASFMRTFVPRQRVDQATEYAASVHGERLATGDTKVAVCASCHGAHGIRVASDAKSPVFPLNVATTCARCHADPSRMQGYTLAGGAPLPTTQHADYEKSVHFTALTKANDLSAPTCNDCHGNHGNHGAAPPGVDAVTNVCGTCHAVFAAKFSASKHAPLFDKGCVECHGNHAVAPPSDAMLGTAKETLCAACHEDKEDPGFVGAGRMRADIETLKASLDRTSALIERVRTAGMEVSDEELALGEARNRLVLARTEIHAFEPLALTPIVSEAHAMLAGVEKQGEAALGELRFRRQGLAVSLVAILLVVTALGLKIRRLDRGARDST